MIEHLVPQIREWMSLNNGFKLNEREYAVVGFLAKNGQIIELNLFNIGQADYCHFPVDQILSRARQINSKSILLIHNHPNNENVSVGDIKLTKYFSDLAAAQDVEIIDHLILKQDSYCLLRKMGYYH